MSTPVDDYLESASSSDESETISLNRSDSPESVCPICLGKMREKAFVNACLHQFCFGCLWDWIKVKLECPLCKQKIISVIHNVKADDDYSEIRVERTQGRETLNADYFPRDPTIPPEGLGQHAPLLLVVPEDEAQLMPELLSPQGTATPSPPPDNVDILAAQALLPSPLHSEILPPLSPQHHAEILLPQAQSPEPYLHAQVLEEQLHPEPPRRAELIPQQNYQPSHAHMHPLPQTQMLPTHTPQSSHAQVMPTQSYPLPYSQAQLVPFPYLPPPPPPLPILTAQSHQYSHPQIVPLQSQPPSHTRTHSSSQPRPSSHAQIVSPQTRPPLSQHAQTMPPIHQPPPPVQFNPQQSHQASRVYVQQSQAHVPPQSRHSEILAQTPPPPLLRLTDNLPAQSHPPPLSRLSETMSPPPLLRITETLPAHTHSSVAASHSHVSSSQRAQTPPPPLIPLADAVPTQSWPLPPPAPFQYAQTSQTQIQQPPPQTRAHQRHSQPSHSVTSAQQTQHSAHDTEPLNLSRTSQRTLLQYAIEAALNSIALPREHQAQLYKQDHQMYRQGLGPPGVPDTDDCVVVKHVRPPHKRTPEMVSYDSDVDWAQVNEQRGFQSMNSNLYLSSPSTSRHVPSYNQAPHPRGYHWRGPLKRRGEYNYSESDSD